MEVTLEFTCDNDGTEPDIHEDILNSYCIVFLGRGRLCRYIFDNNFFLESWLFELEIMLEFIWKMQHEAKLHGEC